VIADDVLSKLGLALVETANVSAIYQKHDYALYRVQAAGTSYVVKWFGGPEHIEIPAYCLLRECGVPTLPVHGLMEHALLLEDLAVSPVWRLATAEDVERAEVGRAVAAWYRRFHEARCRLPEMPSFLAREVDALTPDGIQEIGIRLEMTELPIWQLAADFLEALRSAFRAFPETLNYNDFHWTNLALTREEPLRAVVFDYDLLGIGPVYCDIRKVLSSLGESAQGTFREVYGPVDEQIAVFDRPLSVLYSLLVAIRQPILPAWAQGCAQEACDGSLEHMLRKAIDCL